MQPLAALLKLQQRFMQGMESSSDTLIVIKHNVLELINIKPLVDKMTESLCCG
ncbi:hypothetical protein HU742_024510 [Pseudomonas sp. SWRI102]|uniref:Uncharacterized protein n=1 Tax=Pseudomonas marvdashtae TaxID=2745500 RepID=A0A923JRZ1_9PSED|nr:hypothetical protein [Pseudomonas marvdashtae]MBV4554314.1 hypothetical protein [Pseudomonas marvdashtae]